MFPSPFWNVLIARGSVFNFLNNSIQKTLFFTPAINLVIFLLMENVLLMSVDFPQNKTLQDIMEWKYAKWTNIKVPVVTISMSAVMEKVGLEITQENA